MRITPEGHVCDCEDVLITALLPACPGCLHPLAANRHDPEYGYCINRHRGGTCVHPDLMVKPVDFRWIPRHDLNASDLPESNGWCPVQLRPESAYREPTRWDED
jgi:hypothetical protein